LAIDALRQGADIVLGGRATATEVLGCVPIMRGVSSHMLYENSNPFLLFEPGGVLVVKVSYPRPKPQGWQGERDMHGGQQYVSLLDLRLGGNAAVAE
jgi:hypothetical protein